MSEPMDELRAAAEQIEYMIETATHGELTPFDNAAQTLANHYLALDKQRAEDVEPITVEWLDANGWEAIQNCETRFTKTVSHYTLKYKHSISSLEIIDLIDAIDITDIKTVGQLHRLVEALGGEA